MSLPVPGQMPDFRPSHVVPRDGLPAWEAPDPGLPTVPLDPFLPVRLVDRAGDWGRVLCSNGWSAWVDARLLVPVPDDPPAAGGPLTRTADPRPLIARAEDALGRYRRAVEELAGGRTDGETFRRRTRGLRVGMVVDGESVWLYDAEHERWVYCDGVGLTTYAASSAPSAAAAAGVDEAGRAGAEPVPEEVGGPGPVAVSMREGTAASVRDETAVSVRDESATPVRDETAVSVREEGAGGPAPGYEPTQVVPRADAAAAPPPTRVVARPPDAPDAPDAEDEG